MDNATDVMQMDTTTDMEPADQPSATGAGSAGIVFKLPMLSVSVGCLGMLANGFALLVICGYKKLRTSQTMMLVINQCALDFVAAFFVATQNAAVLHNGVKTAPYGGLAGELYCRVFLVVPHWGTMASSSYNLLAITFERYLMVAHPIYHKTKITKRKLAVLISLVWMIGPLYRLSFSLPTISLQSNLKCKMYHNWIAEGWNTFFGIFTPLFEFFLPAVLMAAMYWRMICVMRRKVRPVRAAVVNPQMAPPGQETNPRSKAEKSGAEYEMSRIGRNLIKTLLVVMVCYVCCWSPNEVYMFLQNSGFEFEVSEAFHRLSLTLVYVNCAINPFIYTFKYKEFQTAMRHLFGRATPGEVSSGSTGGSGPPKSTSARRLHSVL